MIPLKKKENRSLLGITTFIITDLKVNTDCEQLQQLHYTARMNPGGQFDIRGGRGINRGCRQMRPGLKLARSTNCARSKCSPWSWWEAFGSKRLPDLLMTEVLQKKWTDFKVNDVRKLKTEMKWQKHSSMHTALSLLMHTAGSLTASSILISSRTCYLLAELTVVFF